jgi:hypothetical protein
VTDECVPSGTGGHFEEIAVTFDWAGNSEVKNKAGEAGVVDEKVGASAEDEYGKGFGLGEGKGFEEVWLSLDLGEETGRAANAEGSSRR